MPFYHKKVLTDKASTIALIIGEKEWVAPLTTNITIDTTIPWTSGGDMMTAFKDGIAEGANKAINAAQSIGNMGAKIGNTFGGSFSGSQQGKLVTASSSFKKFNGSDTKFTVPSFTCYFINEDDTRSHVDRAKELLKVVLPLVSKSSQSNNNIKYEIAPNDFRTPNEGFNPQNMSGYCKIRIGNRTFSYLVPSNVRVDYSKEVSLLDNNIPHCITISVELEVAFKLMSNDTIALLG